MLLVCSVLCNDLSVSQENSLDSISNATAFPNLSHRVFSEVESRDSECEAEVLDSTALHKEECYFHQTLNRKSVVDFFNIMHILL